MTFNTGIFTRGTESHSYKYEQAFAKGLKIHGHNVIFYKWGSVPTHIDLGVIWGVNNVAAINHLKENDIDYVVLERGYIGDRTEWTSCGFNGLNGRADFCNKNSDSRRLSLVEKYLKPVKPRGSGPIVVMGQIQTDASVKHINFHKWVQTTYDNLSKSCGGEFFYRPHPLDKDPFVPEGMRVIEGTLDEVLDQAFSIFTFNSNTGVDAVLAGVPTITMDKGSMVFDITDHDPTDLAKSGKYRQQWLQDMSYTQWSLDEMASGQTWAHLRRRYNG